MPYKNESDLMLLMLIRQTLDLAFRRNFLSIENCRNATKDIDDKIKELQ